MILLRNHTNLESLEMSDYTIKIITEDMVEDVMDFIWKNFFPDEPLTRSLELKPGFLVDTWCKPHIASGSSLAAVDSQGELLGVRLGKILTSSDWKERFLDTNYVAKKTFLAIAWFTKACTDANTLILLKDKIGYDVWKFMDRVKSKKVYEALLICTKKEGRQRGLGTELVAKSLELAKEHSCEYMYVFVTGNYSAKIFDKLEFGCEGEQRYDEFVDTDGKPLLKDTREHIKAQLRIKKIE